MPFDLTVITHLQSTRSSWIDQVSYSDALIAHALISQGKSALCEIDELYKTIINRETDDAGSNEDAIYLDPNQRHAYIVLLFQMFQATEIHFSDQLVAKKYFSETLASAVRRNFPVFPGEAFNFEDQSTWPLPENLNKVLESHSLKSIIKFSFSTHTKTFSETITNPSEATTNDLLSALIDIIFYIIKLNPKNQEDLLENHNTIECLIIRLLPHTGLALILKTINDRINRDYISQSKKIYSFLQAVIRIAIFTLRADEIFDALNSINLADPKKYELNVPYLATCKFLEMALSISTTVKMLSKSAASTPQNNKSVLFYLLAGFEVDKIQMVYNKFQHRARRINDALTGQQTLNWNQFETEHTPVIMMLTYIMGEHAFTFFNSKVGQTCLPLERMLSQMKVLPHELIRLLKDKYQKETGAPLEKAQTLVNLINIIYCLLDLTDNDSLDPDEQKHFATAIHGTDSNMSTLYKTLCSMLLKSIMPEGAEEEELDLEAIQERVPLHLFVRLLQARNSMKGDEYCQIFLAMLMIDLRPRDKPVEWLCHDTSDDNPVGRILAMHNETIQRKLRSKLSSNPTSYSKSRDVLIDISSASEGTRAPKELIQLITGYLEQTLQSLDALLNSLDESGAAAGAGAPAASKTGNKQRRKIIADLLKDFSKLSTTKFSGIHTQILLKIQKNLDAIKRNLPALGSTLALRRSFLEFKEHYDAALIEFQEAMSKPSVKDTRSKLELRISQWDKNDPRTFFLGDYVGCCLASNATQFPACVQRRMDDGMQFFVATDLKSGKPIALLWMYFAEDSAGNIYLVMNFPEVKATYAQNPLMRKAILTSLLQFVDQYMQDHPGISGFYMKDPDYGHNVGDLDTFEPERLPDGFKKLGGAFTSDAGGHMPFSYSAPESDNIAVQQHYYLNSLSCTSLLLFDAKRLDRTVMPHIITKEAIAKRITLRLFEKEKTTGGDIWSRIKTHLKTQLPVIIGGFFEGDAELNAFIEAQRAHVSAAQKAYNHGKPKFFKDNPMCSRSSCANQTRKKETQALRSMRH